MYLHTYISRHVGMCVYVYKRLKSRPNLGLLNVGETFC